MEAGNDLGAGTQAAEKANILTTDAAVVDPAEMARREKENQEAFEKAQKFNQLRQFVFAKMREVQPSGTVTFNTQFNMVCQFHNIMGTLRDILSTPDQPILERRMKIINEEVFVELFPMLQGLIDGKITWSLENRALMLDHLVDCVYVLLGTAAELGLPFDNGFHIVHVANMEKFRQGVNVNEYGKLMKPEGWVAPNAALEDLIRQVYSETQQETMQPTNLAPGTPGTSMSGNGEEVKGKNSI